MAAQSDQNASPARIVEIATGYMAAKQLFAAADAGVFTVLADGPLDTDQIAERAGIPQRTARILADAMSSLGLLTRVDGRYSNNAPAQEYLAASGGPDLRPFLKFLNTISYPHWLAFDTTVHTAAPAPLDMSGERMGTFMSGVMTYNSLHARMLASVYDFSRHSRVIDVGGLSGAFLVEALKTNPKLEGTFFATGDLAKFASSTLHDASLGDRVSLVDGDAQTDDIPVGFDLLLLEHVIHRFDSDANRALLARARKSAEPGARLILLDFFLDNDPQQRALDALHAGEYLVIDGTIVYPEEEVNDWLVQAGWAPLEKLELPGCPRIIVAEAR